MTRCPVKSQKTEEAIVSISSQSWTIQLHFSFNFWFVGVQYKVKLKKPLKQVCSSRGPQRLRVKPPVPAADQSAEIRWHR